MRKSKWIIIILFVGVAFTSFIYSHWLYSSKVAIQKNSFFIVTEPHDGMAPVLNMIGSAHSSIDLVIYELEDKQIEASLVAAKRQGVKLRVILSSGYEGASSTVNQSAYRFLEMNRSNGRHRTLL